MCDMQKEIISLVGKVDCLQNEVREYREDASDIKSTQEDMIIQISILADLQKKHYESTKPLVEIMVDGTGFKNTAKRLWAISYGFGKLAFLMAGLYGFFVGLLPAAWRHFFQ